MKYVLLAFFLGGVMIAQAGLSRLEALSMIETADNDKTIGSAGEVSRYQIMPRTWKQYTQSEDYQNPAVSGWVAARHVQWLDTTFRAKTGRAPTEFEIYVMWNAGLGYYAKKGFNPAKVAPSIRDRAERFQNLREMKNLQ